MKMFALVAAAAVLSAPAAVAQDAAAGEEAFKACRACHMIVSDDGTEIYKGGRTGPNLYGIVGRPAGAVEDFRYGDDLVKAGEEGLVWTEERIAEYVADPRAFLRSYLEDDSARSKMTYKLRDGGADVAAYLASVAPES